MRFHGLSIVLLACAAGFAAPTASLAQQAQSLDLMQVGAPLDLGANRSAPSSSTRPSATASQRGPARKPQSSARDPSGATAPPAAGNKRTAAKTQRTRPGAAAPGLDPALAETGLPESLSLPLARAVPQAARLPGAAPAGSEDVMARSAQTAEDLRKPIPPRPAPPGASLAAQAAPDPRESPGDPAYAVIPAPPEAAARPVRKISLDAPRQAPASSTAERPVQQQGQSRREQPAQPVLTQSKEPSLEESYCSSAANHASQSLFAWQAERLNALRAELDERIRELEAKKAAYEQWQSRHREQQEKFNANFVAIISRMRPDAAAAQLSNMEEVAAAQIITRLDPRIASTILNEMSPPKAARLADNMTGGPAPAQKR